MALLIPSKFLPAALPPKFLYNLRNYSTELKDIFSEEKERNKNRLKSIIPYACATDISLISGVPEEHICSRVARIFQPPQTQQSGTGNLDHWEIDFDTKQRWENPLMGWCSTGDPLSNMSLKFSSKQDAAEFCERNGWEWYETKTHTVKKFATKSYAKNFLDKRCRVTTK